MGKFDKYTQGRMEGMELALRIAKEKGVEELEIRQNDRNTLIKRTK